jgi:sugar O-acyltransferase (sialic acid O-acetyltransferase NeuD family)
MEKVVVFGNNQTASHTYFYLTHDSPYEVAAFTADGEYIQEDTLFGLPVVPFEDVESIYAPDDYKMSIPITFRNLNKLRAQKYHEAKAKGYQLISHISSKSTTWPGLVIGDNCFIYENCVIQAFAEIGNNVVIAPGCVIGHHSVIKDHCFLAAHTVVLGSVTVEPYCFLGANCTINNNITIARECVVGAGAFINKSTREKGIYIGKEAELMPKSSDQLRTWLTWSVGVQQEQSHRGED